MASSRQYHNTNAYHMEREEILPIIKMEEEFLNRHMMHLRRNALI